MGTQSPRSVTRAKRMAEPADRDASTVSGWTGAIARPSGESAVVVEFGDRIDPALQSRVAALTAALDAAPPPGAREIVPTYRSVLIAFDPRETTPQGVLRALPVEADRETGQSAARAWHVPVCLDDAVAEDLDALADVLDLTPANVRERLLAHPVRVGMYGFVPGAAYLTGLDPRLATPRRTTPRAPVPAGSLIVAAGQAVLLPVSMPTGWYLVGRTAARMFDPSAAERGAPPVPFAVGDELRFEAVSETALQSLERDPRGGVRPIA